MRIFKKMTHKEKIFCKLFLATFDFNGSCEQAKVSKRLTLVKLYDNDSELNTHIREEIDVVSLQNSFITHDLIHYNLYKIVLNGENQHKIQASKILLGIDENSNQLTSFKELVEAINKGK